MANLVQRASDSIPEFRQRYEKFYKQMVVNQLAIGTINDYSSKLAAICLCYSKLPEDITLDEINNYLATLLQRNPVPAKSMFIHTTVGLRCYYRLMGFAEKQIVLPSIRSEHKLPVVFSKREVVALLHCLDDVREKAILTMLYSSGLRVSELCKLEIPDIDSDRMVIHIRQSKGRKDRYVPLSFLALKLLRKYYKLYFPLKYLFNGSKPGIPIEERECREIMSKACHLSNCQKKATCHTLRHSYATHLLEMGENIFSIQQLLGHRNIRSTFIYLHIAQIETKRPFSPLDKLFEKQ